MLFYEQKIEIDHSINSSSFRSTIQDNQKSESKKSSKNSNSNHTNNNIVNVIDRDLDEERVENTNRNIDAPIVLPQKPIQANPLSTGAKTPLKLGVSRFNINEKTSSKLEKQQPYTENNKDDSDDQTVFKTGEKINKFKQQFTTDNYKTNKDLDYIFYDNSKKKESSRFISKRDMVKTKLQKDYEVD